MYQQKQKRKWSAASVLGVVAACIIVFVVWAFQLALSYAFFVGIAPANNPYFPYYGLGLTEGGLVLWMVVFLLSKKPFTRIMALLLAGCSAIASLTLAGTQLQELISAHYDVAMNASRYATVSEVLLAMMIINCIAGFLKLVVWGFSQPGQGFFDVYDDYGVVIAQPQTGYYIPQSAPRPQVVQPKEEQVFEQVATIEPARYIKPMPQMRDPLRPGRRSTEEQWARDDLWWESMGMTDDTCPWPGMNAREARRQKHRPKQKVIDRILMADASKEYVHV